MHGKDNERETNGTNIVLNLTRFLGGKLGFSIARAVGGICVYFQEEASFEFLKQTSRKLQNLL